MQDTFIRRLIELMQKRNMTQTELARRIGTTNVTISRYVSGERKPRIEIVIEIAKVFQVSIDYLLGLSDQVDSNTIINNSSTQLYSILFDLGFLDDNFYLSEKQVNVIKKLLDANKDFIIPLKNSSEDNSKVFNG